MPIRNYILKLFCESQAITIYRGESNNNKNGSYWSTDKEFARNFTQSGQDKEIKTATINKNEIYIKNPLPQATSEREINSAIEEAKKLGFRAILVDEGKNQPNSIFIISDLIRENEYKGEHESPDKDNGAPFYNVIGIYPADFYSSAGYQYASDALDVYSDVKSAFKRPNKRILIYRAVPKDIKTINKGDWVTTSKKYAIEHGKENLNGNYKILSKMVYARDLFTDGNSLLEWGYDPQPEDKNEALKAQIRRKLHLLDKMIKGPVIGFNKNPGESYYGKSIEELTQMKNAVIEKYKDVDYQIS